MNDCCFFAHFLENNRVKLNGEHGIGYIYCTEVVVWGPKAFGLRDQNVYRLGRKSRLWLLCAQGIIQALTFARGVHLHAPVDEDKSSCALERLPCLPVR